MGAWSARIVDNDTTLGLFEHFENLILKGKDSKDAIEEVVKSGNNDISEVKYKPHEEEVVLGLVALQMREGIIVDAELFDRAKSICINSEGIQTFKNQLERQIVLNNFRKEIEKFLNKQ